MWPQSFEDRRLVVNGYSEERDHAVQPPYVNSKDFPACNWLALLPIILHGEPVIITILEAIAVWPDQLPNWPSLDVVTP